MLFALNRVRQFFRACLHLGPLAHPEPFGLKRMLRMPGPGLTESLKGPPQPGQGRNGQYVYWLCMSFPAEATVAEQGIKTPSDFIRATFTQACIQAHRYAKVDMG